MREVNTLQADQKRAFNRLKKAFEDCKKLNVFFANRYGTLEAYDGDLVCGFSNNDFLCAGAMSIPVYDFHSTGNSFQIPKEWADDDIEQSFVLTHEGAKLFDSEHETDENEY